MEGGKAWREGGPAAGRDLRLSVAVVDDGFRLAVAVPSRPEHEGGVRWSPGNGSIEAMPGARRPDTLTPSPYASRQRGPSAADSWRDHP
jgi:hypothetical protein